MVRGISTLNTLNLVVELLIVVMLAISTDR